MKRILLFALILLLAFSTIIWAKTLRVVVDVNYPPYSFVEPSGKVVGICVDLWKEWQKVTGVEVQILPVEWGKAIPMVENGNADVVDEIFYTNERAKRLDFADPYDEVKTVVFFDKNLSGITNDLKTLDGFKIGVKMGDYDASFLVKHGINDLSYYPSYSDIVKAASKGQIHVFVMDEPSGFYYLSKYGILNKFKHSEPLYSSKLYRAVKKGNDQILNLVKSGFSKIPSAYVEKIMKKWKGSPSGFPTWSSIKVFLIIGIVMVILTIVVIIWNRLLSYVIKKRIKEANLEAERAMEAEKKVARMSEQLREVTEHLYKLNERSTKMIRLLSEMSPFSNEKEFAKNVLDLALQFVSEAEGGSLSIIEGERWKYLAASDNYDETSLMNLDLKASWMYKVDKVEVIDHIFEKDREFIPPEIAQKLEEATRGKKVVRSLVVPILLNGQYAGNIFLDTFENVNFSEESKYMMETFGKLVSSFFTIKKVNSLELEHQKKLLKKIVDLLESNYPKTRGHSERVGNLAKNIGKSLSLSEDEIEDVKWCGFLHDIGFVGIPYHIHTKYDLSEEEMDIMKTHPLISELIIESSTLPKRYRKVVRCHHESFDGSGYPDGLKGEEIPLLSRIIAVANEFDELVNLKNIDPKRAIEEIKKESGKKFDPKVVEASIEVLKNFASKLRK